MKQKWSQIENKQRFSIKKLSVGVASVSIGFFITGVPMVQADTSGEGLESTVAVATDMDSRQNSAVEKKKMDHYQMSQLKQSRWMNQLLKRERSKKL